MRDICEKPRETVLMSIVSCHISLKLSPSKFYVHTTISMRHCAIGSSKSTGWCTVRRGAFQLYVRAHGQRTHMEKIMNGE